MSKLTWDQVGEKLYETGVSQGVLYTAKSEGGYNNGVAWNGLTQVSENPSGAEATPVYADNIKYLNLFSAEEFGATIEAYTYPDEFAACDGSAEIIPGATIGQQSRSQFGFCYKTKIGNDVAGDSLGYKIHVVYNCQASPSAKAYQTVNESPEAITFSWEVTTTPVAVEGYKPTATLIIDSTKVDKDKLKAIEDKLYGTEETEPTLPTLQELIKILKNGVSLPASINTLKK